MGGQPGMDRVDGFPMDRPVWIVPGWRDIFGMVRSSLRNRRLALVSQGFALGYFRGLPPGAGCGGVEGLLSHPGRAWMAHPVLVDRVGRWKSVDIPIRGMVQRFIGAGCACARRRDGMYEYCNCNRAPELAEALPALRG